MRSADFAYTRPIILTRTAPFVNNFFIIFHKFFYKFLGNRENFLLSPFPQKKADGFPPAFIHYNILSFIVRLAGQVDTQPLKGLFVYRGENHRGMDLATPELT